MMRSDHEVTGPKILNFVVTVIEESAETQFLISRCLEIDDMLVFSVLSSKGYL